VLVKVAELTGLEPAFLTANNTVYSWTWLDLSNGPLLVEVPPKVLGAINDRGGYNLMNTTTFELWASLEWAGYKTVAPDGKHVYAFGPATSPRSHCVKQQNTLNMLRKQPPR